MSAGSTQLTELLSSAARMDGEAAYEDVVVHAAERLTRLARRMLRAYPHLRRWEETDDVFQEAVLRLCRSLRQMRPESTVEFFGLAALHIRRTLIDLARHHFGPLGVARHYRSDPLLVQQLPQRSARVSSGEPQTLAEWTAFHEAVADLPGDERDVFSAVFYGGVTYGDASELLDISRRTVIRRMNRARIRLARHVIADFGEPAKQ